MAIAVSKITLYDLFMWQLSNKMVENNWFVLKKGQLPWTMYIRLCSLKNYIEICKLISDEVYSNIKKGTWW